METSMQRGDFLRAGAALVGGLAGGGAIAAAADGRTPAQPAGDDIGYVKLAATAERICLQFFDRALSQGRDHLDDGDLRRFRLMRAADADHLRRLGVVLQDTPPRRAGEDVFFPRGSFSSGRRIAQTGARLEQIITGAYASACAFVQDAGTRALFARLLMADARHLAEFRIVEGATAAPRGLPALVNFDRATNLIDAYLQPNAPAAEPIPSEDSEESGGGGGDG